MWHLRETVSRAKKSHCHAYEPDLAGFKILLYHFGSRRTRVPPAHIYRVSSLVLGERGQDFAMPYMATLDHENMIDAVLDNRGASGLAVLQRQEKDLTVGPSRPRHRKG